MNDQTRRWEEGVRARLDGEKVESVRNEDKLVGWVTADNLIWWAEKAPHAPQTSADREARLMALWLEHRASELEAEADKLEEIADHTACDRLREEAQGHRGSARAIRRELLGEVVDAR